MDVYLLRRTAHSAQVGERERVSATELTPPNQSAHLTNALLTRHFKTEDYAPLKKKRQPLQVYLTDGGEWTSLPRGDGDKEKKMVKAALAKIRATVIHDVLDEALDLALADFGRAAQQSRGEERKAERLRAQAARFRQNVDHKTQKHQEVSAMIASYEAEDSSDNEDGADWNMGCEVSFMKMAPAGAAKRQRKASQRTKRLPNDPHNRPAVQPSTFGNWGDSGGAPAGAGAAKPGSTVNPITFGSWAGDGPPPGGANPAAAPTEAPKKGGAIRRVPGTNRVGLSALKQLTRSMTPETIRPEFDKIPLNRPNPKMLNASAHALTANVNIFPFPHSRVKAAKGQYINASYIRGADGFPSKYIATQVPVIPGGGGFGQKLPTVNLFWEMILEHRSAVIVLLDESATPFWPIELNKPKMFGSVQVTAHNMVPGEDFTTITLSLKAKGSTTQHHATMFEFQRWNDQLNNDMVSALLELSNSVEVKAKESATTPIVMIDAEGGDRVGTMIAAEHCFEQIRSHDYVDVVRAVADVREDRGGLVSRPELYAGVYRFATVYLLGMGVSMNRADAPPGYASVPTY